MFRLCWTPLVWPSARKTWTSTAAATRLCREFLNGAPNGLKASLWITDFKRKKGFWGVNWEYFLKPHRLCFKNAHFALDYAIASQCFPPFCFNQFKLTTMVRSISCSNFQYNTVQEIKRCFFLLRNLVRIYTDSKSGICTGAVYISR